MSTGDGSTGPGRWIFSIGSRAPIEIRLAGWLLVAGGLLFVLVDVLWSATDGGGGAFLVSVLQLVIAIGVTGGLLRGMRSARIVGLLFALTVAFLHILIALQSLPVWVRIVAGAIAVSQVYVAVLLNTRPALEHTGGVRR
ncbi:MAG TPA: hypothetical protein VGJ95_19875 [Pseudonocardiaceae bacterium]|jgi:hypothetical protein